MKRPFSFLKAPKSTRSARAKRKRRKMACLWGPKLGLEWVRGRLHLLQEGWETINGNGKTTKKNQQEKVKEEEYVNSNTTVTASLTETHSSTSSTAIATETETETETKIETKIKTKIETETDYLDKVTTNEVVEEKETRSGLSDASKFEIGVVALGAGGLAANHYRKKNNNKNDNNQEEGCKEEQEHHSNSGVTTTGTAAYNSASATMIKMKVKNGVDLKKETSAFLKKEILAVGIFDVSLDFASRTLAPAAAGVDTYTGTKFIEKQMGCEGTGAKVAAAAVGVASAAGTKHVMHVQGAKKQGMTPLMICAVTKNNICLLDWVGNHNKRKGPTRISFEFSRKDAKIK